MSKRIYNAKVRINGFRNTRENYFHKVCKESFNITSHGSEHIKIIWTRKIRPDKRFNITIPKLIRPIADEINPICFEDRLIDKEDRDD